MAETTLYRAYDDAGRLLYVGIAGSPFARLGQHNGAGWTRHAVSITLERHEDREAAAAAELAAIRTEDPVWNMSGRPMDRHFKWMLAYPKRHADEVTDEELERVMREAADSLRPVRIGGAA